MALAPTVRSGIDLGNIDNSVRVQDDPFGWLLGKWLKEYEIPADRAMGGVADDLVDKVSQQLRDLIAGLDHAGSQPGTDAQRIGDFFASYMDTATIAAVGVQPLLAELDRVENVADAAALAKILGTLLDVNTGFDVSVYGDPKNSSRNILHFEQAGLALPDRSYYLDPRYAETLAAYPEHIARMFALVYGGSAADYAHTAARIVALESKLAAAQWDNVKSRDPELTYNMRSLAALAAESPGFDWAGWLDAYGVKPEHTAEMLIYQPDYLTAFAQAFAAEPLQDWKDWTRWQTIHARAALLTDDIVDEDFAFFRQRINGTVQISDRGQRALRAVEGALGNAVGKLYVEKHFSQEAKRQIEEMVDNLLAAYRQSIAELDWMTPETRARALEKLDKITVKVGYPESWIDYSNLVIERGDLYGNYVRGQAADLQRYLDRLGKPVDRSAWGMTPQTVNAYYSPMMNEIVFPAAFLQAPFFDTEADIAASYGAIGATIGHEIGHAFDDNGSRYDGDGNLVDWWTAVDRAAFEAKTAVLVEQFDGYVPRQLPGGSHVNGTLTLGENIADLGGLAIALKAYTTSLDGKPDPVIDGYTGTQRVLLGYVQSWQLKARDAEVLRRLATDVHAPPEFRVNGILRNLDAFYDAFGVDESSPLWVAPEDRVRIWY
ncbi:M13 family metallopeptidase [Mycolicibacterium vaccae]|uniref:M13 family metallopeptidase n=1 Tax=Mycolicibacterium vaccae TaxID=1810 RepID=UPI00058CE87F|nr:M13-type metalloendopeptidase [Mycolicibacterium vaccae]